MTRAPRSPAPAVKQPPPATRVAEADKRLMRGAAAVVGFVFDMAPEALLRQTRGSGMESAARQVMLAVVRRAKSMTNDPSSIQRLGRSVSRDRTTVAHALHKIESAADTQEATDNFLDKLAGQVRDLLLMQDVAQELLTDGFDGAPEEIENEHA